MSTRTYQLPTGTGAYVATGADEAFPLVNSDQVTALSMIGRRVHLTGTAHHGWAMSVDGPDWVVTLGPDTVSGRLSLVHPLPNFGRPFVTVRWADPYRPGGLVRMGVSMDDLTPGWSLVHPGRV
jgi:hypothetical protein